MCHLPRWILVVGIGDTIPKGNKVSLFPLFYSTKQTRLSKNIAGLAQLTGYN